MVALNPILFEAIHRSEQELRERELNHRLAQRERNGVRQASGKPGFGDNLVGLVSRIGGWFTGQHSVAPSCDC